MIDSEEKIELRFADNERSEEVQAIIERMPTGWATLVACLMGVLVLFAFALGFVIKYPDTVDGQITITSSSAPVRLVANVSGKLRLLCTERTVVSEGQVVAYIENGADYRDVLLVDSLLVIHDRDSLPMSIFPSHGLLLGEVSAVYSSFVVAGKQYERAVQSDVYRTVRESLRQQTVTNLCIIGHIDTELSLRGRSLLIEVERTRADSLLYHVKKVISTDDYRKQQAACYNQQGSYEELQNSRLSYIAQNQKNEQQIQQSLLEEQENIDKLKSELQARRNELASGIRQWKEKYLQYSPIGGELEYLGFWRENNFVQSGQEVFSILPDRNDIVGEVIVLSYGIGKVETGQTVHVKVSNYPYDEYGLICGRVHAVSRLSNRIQAEDDAGNQVYRILITFPDGLRTNFGRILSLDFETRGTAEIITKPRRLIERLFDNLKAATEK